MEVRIKMCFLWILILSVMFEAVEALGAYICGDYICSGPCCGEHCCHHSVWMDGWFWVMWMAVLCIMLGCTWCCRRIFYERRMRRQNPDYVILPQNDGRLRPQQVVYGTVEPHSTNIVTVSPATAPPVPPAYLEKPPDYNAFQAPPLYSQALPQPQQALQQPPPNQSPPPQYRATNPHQ